MTSRWAQAASAVLGALLVGALVAWHEALITRGSLTALLAVVVPVPVLVRAAQRRFDVFEPIVIVSAGLFVLFVLRPFALIQYDELFYRGYSVVAGFESALMIALVGIIALYAGYAWDAGDRLAGRLWPLPATWSDNRANVFAIVTLGGALALFAAFALQIGGLGTLLQLLAGRSNDDGAIYGNASAYLYWGPFMAIPSALILLESAARRRAVALRLIAGFAVLFVVLVTGPRGDRLWLLTLLSSIAMLPYLRWERRPRMTSLLAALLGTFALVTFLGEVRVPAARAASPSQLFEQSLKNPLRGTKDFILGSDTEMFSVLSVLSAKVPREKDHHYGITLISLLTNPVPDVLWTSKPQTADIEVYTELFPEQARVTKAGTAPSMFGGFYYDSGLPGVAFGAAAAGIFMRLLFQYFRRNSTNPGVRLLYAASLPLTVILLRGNPTDTFSRALFIVGPILLCIYFARGLPRSECSVPDKVSRSAPGLALPPSAMRSR